MGYVGNQTTNSYTSLDKQTITGNGGTSYTLDHAVANVNEIEVFVNNVRQEPSVAYTVSGTALTMTGNVEASDDFYVVFQGKAVQTVVPPSDSITSDMINDDAVKIAHINEDFYKTGTWTPAIGGNSTTGAPVYTTRNGKYTKIGQLVYLNFNVGVSSWTTAPSGTVRITGIPYTPNDEAVGSLMAHDWDWDTTSPVTTSLYTANNQDYLRIFTSRDNLSWQEEQIANEEFELYCSITYTTDE